MTKCRFTIIELIIEIMTKSTYKTKSMNLSETIVFELHTERLRFQMMFRSFIKLASHTC